MINFKFKNNITLYTIIGCILGIIFGIFLPSIMNQINFLGDIYINLLKIMIVPVLFFGIVSALISNKDIKTTSKITIYSIIIFIVMFIISFIVNSGFVMIIKPGNGFVFDAITWDNTLADTSFKGFILNLFSSTSIIDAMSKNSLITIIIFAFTMGIAINKCNDVNDKIKDIFYSLNLVFNKMLEWVMFITPIGCFALMGNTVASYGASVFTSIIKYVGMAWIGCLIIAAVIMILPVWAIAKINPIEYIKKVSEIWMITLSTCSSTATLPNTIKVCNNKFNIPENITNIVVPLGCTIHMCGGAVSFSLLALFNMQMYGIKLTFPLFIFMMVSALLINMGAPGIPGGGIVIGATYLTLLGIPMEFIGFYAGFYRLLDMIYTTMNVTGDISANIIINKLISKE